MPSEEKQVGFAMDRAASVPLDSDFKPKLSVVRSASVSLDDQLARTASKSRQTSFSPGLKTVGHVYRTRKSFTAGLWRDSAVSDSVSSRHDIQALKDLCGSDDSFYIDSDDLKHVKSLGEGAFAGTNQRSHVDLHIWNENFLSFCSWGPSP